MELTDRWAMHYYEWSVGQAEQEFCAGFPLLSLVQGSSAFKLIECAGSLNSDERRKLAVALVKRFNERAMNLKGHIINVEERSLIERYLDYNIRITEAGKRRMLPFASEAERRISDEIHSGRAQKGRASLVRKVLSERIEQKLGPPAAKPSGAQNYAVEIPGWRLRTTIDYGGSYGQITYAHTIASTAGSPTRLQPPIHLCGCMGVAGRTSWDLYTVQDTESVASSIYSVVCWFVDRWLDLTEHLKP
jgi:hypothetical protein